MKIQLITIGNELLNGKIQDRNAYWLARFCHEHDLDLIKNDIIPDNEYAFMKAFKGAWQDADLVVTSGGLGPTKDDLTKGMLARFFDKNLVESKQALEVTKKNYAKSKREYNPELQYSKIPEGFTAVYNKAGYAPGLFYQENRKMAAALPGVPVEFKTMFMEEILKKLKESFPKSSHIKKHVIVKTWRAPEAKIFNSLCPGLWEDLERFGEVSSLPNPLGVDIGVSITASDQPELEMREQSVRDAVLNSALKDFIWHIGKESLEEVIVKKALEKNMTLGFAESCTGGLCASRITDIPGSSRVFAGSVVAYSNRVKEKILNVNASTLEKYGAVSSETAWEMAQGARSVLEADLVVTTTGVAGPGGGSAEKPVGTVGVGYSSQRDCAGNLHHFPEMDREDLKRIFSQIALITLLEQVELY
ncbi:MAG: nicotinamide-nucleotide amidohydrolase family protein [Bacteriovoracaceae bacterium]